MMMIDETAAPEAPQGPAPRMARRTDVRTRDLVNQAVASVPTLGLQRAAEFLAAMNVPAEVAVRALVYPKQRGAS